MTWSERIRSISYQSRCDQHPDEVLGDEAHTVRINPHGDKENLSPRMRDFLNYIITGKAGEEDDAFRKKVG